MSRSGFEGAAETYEDPLLRRALQWAEAELVDEAVRVKKAPRMPILMFLSMELTVMSADSPRVHRMYAWARLIKVYGGLRWDDLQRLRPTDVELREAGLVGRLARTKTSGVGRRVRELPLFIPKGASLAATTWVETGFYLWKELFPLGRDFFLPRPPWRPRVRH
jgi:integrase